MEYVDTIVKSEYVEASLKSEYSISKDPTALCKKPYRLELDGTTHCWVLKKDLVNKLRKLEGRPKCKGVLAYVNSQLGEVGRQPASRAIIHDTLNGLIQGQQLLSKNLAAKHMSGMSEASLSDRLDALDAKMDRVIEMHAATADAVDEVSLKLTEMSIFTVAVERMAKRVHAIHDGISNIEEVIDQARFLSSSDREEGEGEVPLCSPSSVGTMSF